MLHRIGLHAWNVAIAVLFMTLLAPETLGQRAAPPGGRDGDRGGRGEAARGGMIEWFIRDARNNVGLSEQQQARLRASLQELGRQAQEQFRNMRPDPGAWETFRTLQQQIEAAAAAGDDAKVEQLQKQMDGMAGPAMFREMRARGLAEVEKVLEPGQRRAFEQWRGLQESRLPPFMLTDPASLRQAIDGISTLSAAQKEQLNTALQRYERASERLGPDDVVGRNRLRNRLGLAVQEVLKPSQQVLLSTGLQEQMRRQMMQNRPGWQGRGGEVRGRRGDTGGRFGGRGRTERPTPGSRAEPADPWTAYVQAFVARHNLDAGQSEAAYSILRELRQRAAEYSASRRSEFEQLQYRASQADSPEAKAAVDAERKTLEEPVEAMFQELKDRLDTLPSAAQRAVASQPAASNRPQAARGDRAERSAATQRSRRGRN